MATRETAGRRLARGDEDGARRPGAPNAPGSQPVGLDSPTAGAATSRPPVLDPRHVASLREVDGTGEALRRLSSLFLDGTPAIATELARAAADADLEAVESAAHNLKGTGGVLGASALAAVAGIVEVEARNGRLPDELTLARLRRAVEAAMVAVRSLLRT